MRKEGTEPRSAAGDVQEMQQVKFDFNIGFVKKTDERPSEGRQVPWGQW